MPILVYGKAEQFEKYRKELERLPKGASYIKVPHSAQKLVRTLNIIAEDEPVTAIEFSSLTEHSKEEAGMAAVAEKSSFRRTLQDVKDLSGAACVVIFQINLNSMETDIYDSVGQSIQLTQFDMDISSLRP
jgi:hypothetical protein